MQHGDMDIQHGQAARKSSTDTQNGHKAWIPGQAAWTWTYRTDMDMRLEHGHAARTSTCSMDMDMQQVMDMDMQRGITCSIDRQYGDIHAA